MRSTTFVALLAWVAVVVACGSDDDRFASRSSPGSSSGTPTGTTSGGAGTPGSTCEQLTELACERACACNDDRATGDPEECGWYFEDGGTTSSSSRSRDVCALGATNDVCGDTTKTEQFFVECLSAMQSAPDECRPAETDNDPWAFVLPPECFSLFECNAGPCLN